MTRVDDSGRVRRASLREAIGTVFGLWPGWPWSVLALLVAGGFAGAAAAPALRARGAASAAALGTFACAGYGIAAAAALALVPRIVRLLWLRRGVAGRPATTDGSWWPLRLLPAALVSTPRLRRTPEEFTTAVAAAAADARGFLVDRLWPVWAAAFVVPVLGLVTAWQNGAKVQLRFAPDADPGTVLPALVAQVSPPMVATIAAALGLMVLAVAVDQWTKGLLQRWRGVVEPGDGHHPAVVELLPPETLPEPASEGWGAPGPEPAPSPAPEPVEEKLPRHPVDPDELDRLWRRSQGKDR